MTAIFVSIKFWRHGDALLRFSVPDVQTTQVLHGEDEYIISVAQDLDSTVPKSHDFNYRFGHTITPFTILQPEAVELSVCRGSLHRQVEPWLHPQAHWDEQVQLLVATTVFARRCFARASAHAAWPC